MDIVHLRCTSQTCVRNPQCVKHCRANVLLPFRKPIILPPQGSELPPEVKEQVLKVLPYLCSQAKPGTCKLEIAADSELSSHAAYLYEALRETPLAPEARKWVRSIVRYTDEVPEVVHTALSATNNDLILDLVVEARDRLWATTATHQLA